jgi:hypothetical protein
MATQLKLRGGTTAQHASFTGAEKEVTVDTTKDTLVVHDGATAGGFPLAKESAVAAKANSSDVYTKTQSDAAYQPIDADLTDLSTYGAGTGNNQYVKRDGSAKTPIGTNWKVYESGGVLFFETGGVAKAKLDSSGNLTVVGNVTAYGTM